MQFEFDDLKNALFIVGLGLSVVATTLLYLGYYLISSGTVAVLFGAVFVVYYLITGTLGGVLLLIGVNPYPKLNYVLPAVALAQFILAFLTITTPTEFSPTSLILLIPPTLISVKTGLWLSRKGTVKEREKFKFFKKLC